MTDLLTNIDFNNYTLLSWKGTGDALFYFMAYSFLGWVLENSYSFITRRGFFKEGFFKGPFKPMYGFAPLILIFLLTPNTHWLVFILLCFLIPTSVEYISGHLLQKFFHRRWWDYSNIPFQLQGHVCLIFSLCWILLSLLTLKYIHPILILVYGPIQSYWTWFYPFVAFYFLGETFAAIKRNLADGLLMKKSPNAIQ